MAWKWLQKMVCPPCPGARELVYAYYGTGDGQVAATQNHVNAVHVGSWGDWSMPGRDALMEWIIGYGKEAKAAGLPIIWTTDWCLFQQTNPRIPLDPEISRGYLDQFFTRIRAEGLIESTIAFYPIDEPNIHEVAVSNDDMNNANNWLRAVAGFYWNPAKPLPLLVIYGAGGGNPMSNLPGISTFDWCGVDNYGADIFTNGNYQTLLAQMRSEQKTIYVPGGGDPWREAPMPWYTRAQQDPRVAMIMPFIWLSVPERMGIGENGMAPQYEAVGSLIVNA